MTWRDTNCGDRAFGHPGDDRLHRAAAPSSPSRRFSSSPSSISGENWPTAVAMFCSTGSTRSGAFFETTSTMPRSMRMTAAVLAPMPPPVSILASTVDISSLSRSALPARPIRSVIAASSSSKALPCRQFVIDAIPDGGVAARSVRAAPRRSRFRAARRDGRPSWSRRGRCRRRPAPIPASARAAAGTRATPRRRRPGARSAVRSDGCGGAPPSRRARRPDAPARARRAAARRACTVTTSGAASAPGDVICTMRPSVAAIAG